MRQPLQGSFSSVVSRPGAFLGWAFGMRLSMPVLLAAVAYYIAPADFATIYDLPANLTGAGVTIGIVSLSRISPISTTSAS
jgi:hypothetical protein